MFLTKPTEKDITDMISTLITRFETPPPVEEVYLTEKEVEEILLEKELIEEDESWNDFIEKPKPVISETPK